MSVTSAVGGFDLPLPAGATNAPIHDIAVVAMIDYLGFWLRTSLNTAVAQVQGRSADICPAANVFPYNPGENWVRNPLPALYGWWNGDALTVPHTLAFDARQRTLTVQWIYEELYSPLMKNGAIPIDARNGFSAYVDAVIRRACNRSKHPSYGYNGAAAGTPIWRSMGVLEWKILASKSVGIASVPGGADNRAGGDNAGHIVRYHPTVIAQVLIKERMLNDTVVDPGDVMLDSVMQIDTTEIGDPLNPVEFAQVVVPGPPERP